MAKKIRYTTEQFVERAKQRHGDTYDYSSTIYCTSHDPITVICKKHGFFAMRAYSHLQGAGCNLCGIERTRTNFIERANEVHGTRYDYSLVEYKRLSNKIKIVCQKHGVFEQSAESHLRGSHCSQCANEVKRTDGVYHDQFFCTQERREIDGRYYVVQMDNDTETFLKIGITKCDLRTRYGSKLPYSITPIIEKKMKLVEAYEIEQQMLTHQWWRYVPQQKFNGHTECFDVGAKEILTNVQ